MDHLIENKNKYYFFFQKMYILNIIIFEWNSYNVSNSNIEEIYGTISKNNIFIY